VTAGSAGAVATSDGRATVTWQPGAVPVGSTIGLESTLAPPSLAGTAVSLSISPEQSMLPWPVDVVYSAAPPTGTVVGFSTDGRTWRPVPQLTFATGTVPALQGTVPQGTYLDGSVLHLLTRQSGRVALFRAGAWGDPSRVSASGPSVRRLAPLRVTRQRDGSLLLTTRLSTSSQAALTAEVLATNGVRPWILKRGSRLAVPLGAGATRRVHALVLQSGGFPLQLRLSAHALASRALVRILVTATDPWTRSGAFTISFRVP
jgi:hypothetical protein